MIQVCLLYRWAGNDVVYRMDAANCWRAATRWRNECRRKGLYHCMSGVRISSAVQRTTTGRCTVLGLLHSLPHTCKSLKWLVCQCSSRQSQVNWCRWHFVELFKPRHQCTRQLRIDDRAVPVAAARAVASQGGERGRGWPAAPSDTTHGVTPWLKSKHLLRINLQERSPGKVMYDVRCTMTKKCHHLLR